MRDKSNIKKRCKTNKSNQPTMKLSSDILMLIHSLSNTELELWKEYNFAIYSEVSKRLSFKTLLEKIKRRLSANDDM